MNSDKIAPTPLVWLGGGLLGVILAYLGFLPTDNGPSPPPQKNAPGVLSSLYPAVKGSTTHASSMWEDPFKKLDEDKLTHSTEPSTEFASLIASRLQGNQKIMFLVVPVVETNDAFGTESRRRRRHAVELALANQDFSPLFNDRMTYRQVKINCHFTDRASSKDSAGNDVDPLVETLSLDLPTNLYSHKTSNDLVLLTWIKQSHLGKRPLNTIHDILEHVVLDIDKERAAFCLLWPTRSNEFKELVTDCKNVEEQSKKYKEQANLWVASQQELIQDDKPDKNAVQGESEKAGTEKGNSEKDDSGKGNSEKREPTPGAVPVYGHGKPAIYGKLINQ